MPDRVISLADRFSIGMPAAALILIAGGCAEDQVTDDAPATIAQMETTEPTCAHLPARFEAFHAAATGPTEPKGISLH